MDKKEYLQSVYRKAVGAGLCKTMKEFSDLLNISRSGLSCAMNGNEKYLTDSLVRKVKIFAEREGLDVDSPTPKVDTRPGVLIPAETLDLYTNLSESIKNLSELLTKMQTAAATPSVGIAAPKNYRVD